jgi:hypothetical protein
VFIRRGLEGQAILNRLRKPSIPIKAIPNRIAVEAPSGTEWPSAAAVLSLKVAITATLSKISVPKLTVVPSATVVGTGAGGRTKIALNNQKAHCACNSVYEATILWLRPIHQPISSKGFGRKGNIP